MAFVHSPKIVTDGLVLALDAGNVKSYPGSGTTWLDKSGRGNNGTLTNGPTFNSDNGGSIVFDGVNDYVSLGAFPGLGTTNRTIGVWFKVSTTPSGVGRIITFPADETLTDTPAYTLAINTSLEVGAGIGGFPYNGYISSFPYTLNTWINITTAISGNTVNVYRNAILMGSVTNTGTVATNQIGYLGRYNNYYGQYLNGNISNVQLYNRALSASEILQNYNATKGRFGL